MSSSTKHQTNSLEPTDLLDRIGLAAEIARGLIQRVLGEQASGDGNPDPILLAAHHYMVDIEAYALELANEEVSQS